MKIYFGCLFVILSVNQIGCYPSSNQNSERELVRRIYKTVHPNPHYQVNEIQRVKEALKRRVLENVHRVDSLKASLKRVLGQDAGNGFHLSSSKIFQKKRSKARLPHSYMFRKRQNSPGALGLWGREVEAPGDIGPPGIWGDVVPDETRKDKPGAVQGLWGKDERVIRALLKTLKR
uniref:Peptide 2 n=1 Tax=Clytia hemisphaerica TaxID=252671 RepID=A0A0U4ID31_9CNID|nr:peptide precursor 2 [Clytia hemisphaerica]